MFRHLDPLLPVDRELLAATGGFLGGTLFKGLTCSAFAAGVMAIGLAIGEIEHSRLRVLRMVARLLTRGDAFDDRINRFNRVMNLGNEMSEWFAREFGSTRCRAIARADFSSTAGVLSYIRQGGIDRCRSIAERVADQVRDILQEGGSHPLTSASG